MSAGELSLTSRRGEGCHPWRGHEESGARVISFAPLGTPLANFGRKWMYSATLAKGQSCGMRARVPHLDRQGVSRGKGDEEHSRGLEISYGAGL